MRDAYLGKGDADELEVWPQNWRAVTFFQMSATQWTRDIAGNISGLNYPAVISILTSYRIPARQHGAMLGDIRLIECGALEALREKAD